MDAGGARAIKEANPKREASPSVAAAECPCQVLSLHRCVPGALICSVTPCCQVRVQLGGTGGTSV